MVLHAALHVTLHPPKLEDDVIDVQDAAQDEVTLLADTDVQLFAHPLQVVVPLALPLHVVEQPAPHPLHDVDTGFTDATEVQLAPHVDAVVAPAPPLQLSLQPPTHWPVQPMLQV